MSRELLTAHKVTWSRKRILRDLYCRWYSDIVKHLNPGIVLEIGSGTGNFGEFHSHVITSDIVPTPWIDVCVDAQAMPFGAGSFESIVLCDVLHHISSVRLFFAEALRVLKPGGRVALLEPCISPWSRLVFKLFHKEPVDLGARPLDHAAGKKDPFESNQAIPTILFMRDRRAFQRAFPGLRLIAIDRSDFLAYPLSGGFDHRALLPEFILRGILAVEKMIPFVSRLFAFRVLVMLEKTDTRRGDDSH